MKKYITLTISLLILFFGIYKVSAEESYTLKVLVIEIDPILQTVQNKSLYPNNDGHPHVSEYFGQNKERAISEVKDDLESMSHNYLKIEIVGYEKLDEFPTYKSNVTLNNGEVTHRYDEETFISMAKSSKNRDVGSWIDLYYYPTNKPLDYSFDYDYIVNKYNLAERRNNGEFDQVWLVVIDPAATHETIMVGNHTYWINGTPVYADCKNFMIATISIARRDSNLHAFAHSSEFVLNNVYQDEFLDYTIRYHDSTEEGYNKLNLWNKFSMTNYQSNGQNAGVGNVHFPYNGVRDYDYSNTTMVYSNWKDWLNYPNLTNTKELSNNDAWMTFEPNTTLGPDDDKDPNRLYIRFWYYLMPHIEGRTVDGYYHNWWKYTSTLDFITEIKMNDFVDKDYLVGETISVDIDLNYKSGDVVNYKTIEQGENIQIVGDSIQFENGELKAVKEGKSILTLCFDGKCLSYNVYTELPPKVDNSSIIFLVFISILVAILIIATIIFSRKKVHNEVNPK